MPSPNKKPRRKLTKTLNPLTEAQLYTARLYQGLDRSRFNAAANRKIDEAIRMGVGVRANALPKITDILKGEPTIIQGAAAGVTSALKRALSQLDTQNRVARQRKASSLAEANYQFGSRQTSRRVSRRKGHISGSPTVTPSKPPAAEKSRAVARVSRKSAPRTVRGPVPKSRTRPASRSIRTATARRPTIR